ncbi:putative prolyl 4-hydroxylase [Tetrabaena socialis]|uniref:Putative prolyl 4-hydroxylase n=1 Tax=Tetrabaena socialis TaxID=47790 RepID=A0A2J8AJ40_9CHLO|nr:putative prolyl 4-hydroxylase [Tetrabaena socialis]|eukprot:PNH12528.1 putative prolyl 4-hydroxylase [Tetrabaena socialis]
MEIRRRGDETYFFYEISGFLTPKECKELIEVAQRAGLSKSEIYGADTDTVDNSSRLSYTVWLKTSAHPVVSKISKLTEAISGLPEENQEELQVVHYPEGGFFNPHFDCCDGGPKECNRMNSMGGPRHMTIIIYLNDEYTGGETAFPNLNLSIRPEVGKAGIFWSTDKDNGVVQQSFHGGNPVRGGEKWICNKWVHPQPYR